MATKAELRARLTLDKSLFDRGLVLAQAGATRMASGLTSIARVGATAFAVAGAAAIGLSAALAIGVKKAFDLGGSLSDMSKITGRGVKEILLLKRALQDAGVSAEKIDRYILTGKDRGNVIGRALKNLTDKDWADASASVGKQAGILQRDAELFDRVSDLLGRSGDKLQGFFVGVADRVQKVLLPILEKFDKTDFSSLGQKFGDGLIKGAEALVGFFKNPSLIFDAATSYLRVAVLGVGNVLIATFQTGLTFFKDGLLSVFAGIGSVITATLLEAFQKPIAYLQAGIQEALAPNGGSTGTKVLIKEKTIARNLFGYNMSGQLSSYGKAIQKDIDQLTGQLKTGPTFQQRYQQILKEGAKFGLGNGMTTQQWNEQGRKQVDAGINKAIAAAKGFKVADVLGASAAMSVATRTTQAAVASGEQTLFPSPSTSHNYGGWGALAGFSSFDGAPALGGVGGGAYNQSGNIWAPGSYLNPAKPKQDAGAAIVDGVTKSNDKLQQIVDALTD